MIAFSAKQGTCALMMFAGVFGAAIPAMAQSGASPSIQSVITYRIKPDRMSEWSDLRKQVVAIHKKAGLDYATTVWRAESGPMEYLLVRYYSKWAGLGSGPSPKLKDYQGELAPLTSRMMQCLESMERRLGVVTDWSTRPAPGEPMPKMVRALRSMVRQGHNDAYLDLVKSEVMPAYKQAGVKWTMVVRPAYGTAQNEMVSVIPADWADLDQGQPLAKALGQEGYAKLLKKLDEHVTRREAQLYRYMPNLSYLPGGGSGPSSSGN